MSGLPFSKACADELRAVFGAAEINQALKTHGYLIVENGQRLDTRKVKGGTEISVSQMVIRRPEQIAAEAHLKGRRG